MLHCYLWVSLLCCERYIFLYTVVPNLVSFVTFIAEIAHGEKSRTQSITQSLTHSLSLFDAPGTEALALRNNLL